MRKNQNLRLGDFVANPLKVGGGQMRLLTKCQINHYHTVKLACQLLCGSMVLGRERDINFEESGC